MQNLTSILDDLQMGFDDDEIGLGEIVEHFEDRGFGPLLLVPALIAATPISDPRITGSPLSGGRSGPPGNGD